MQKEGSSSPNSINWDDIVKWKELPEPEKVVLLNECEEKKQDIIDAKEKELRNLLENNVFEEVEDKGQRRVTTKWIITEKEKDEEKIVKARLVARGFEEKLENTRIDSPTCSRQSLRMCFIVAPTMKWEIHSLDISSAFLQGNNIERELYLEPPIEVKEDGIIWKLKRCIYGLSDAPRAWYERVEQELCALRAKKSLYDDAVFIWHQNNTLIGLVVIHVDDFVYCGTSEWNSNVMGAIQKVFKISARHRGTFKYIGLNIQQTNDGIHIDQQPYVESVKCIPLSADRMKMKDSALTSIEKSQLRSLTGQLLWATSQTRPDVAFDACVAGNYGKDASIKSILLANKCVKKLQAEKVKIRFVGLKDIKNITVIAYADASHANLPSGASQGGMIVFLECNGMVAPVMWQSKKTSRVPKSPFAAETMMQAEAADTGALIARMAEEIFALPAASVKVECRTDSKSLIDHLVTSHIISDSRLRVDIARLKEMVEVNEIEMRWVPDGEQLAHPLTKAGTSGKRLLQVLAQGHL